MRGYDTEGSNSSLSSTGYIPKKCSICKKRFRSQSAWNRHARKRDWGCKKHRECFPSDEILTHAKDEYHTKCFVPGCTSEYAPGTWADSDIVEHVEQEHTDWGSESSSHESD